MLNCCFTVMVAFSIQSVQVCHSSFITFTDLNTVSYSQIFKTIHLHTVHKKMYKAQLCSPYQMLSCSLEIIEDSQGHVDPISNIPALILCSSFLSLPFLDVYHTKFSLPEVLSLAQGMGETTGITTTILSTLKQNTTVLCNGPSQKLDP